MNKLIYILGLCILFSACANEASNNSAEAKNEQNKEVPLVNQDYFCMTYATKVQTFRLLNRQRALFENAVMDEKSEKGAFVSKLKQETDRMLSFVGNGEELTKEDVAMMQQICDENLKFSNAEDNEAWKLLVKSMYDQFYQYQKFIKQGLEGHLDRFNHTEKAYFEIQDIASTADRLIEADSYARLLQVLDWQIRVLNMEIACLDLILGKPQRLVYDRFMVLNEVESNIVKKGENLKGRIKLGAYSSQADFDVRINNRPVKVVDGMAKFEKEAVSLGENTYDVEILIKNPLTGETERFVRTYTYTVVE